MCIHDKNGPDLLDLIAERLLTTHPDREPIIRMVKTKSGGHGMRSFWEFGEMHDSWTDQDDEIATDIRSILDWCPGEIRSRKIERAAPAHDASELGGQAVRLRKCHIQRKRGL